MSKGLEALTRMYEHLDVDVNYDDYAYEIADKDYDIIEKGLKALEIIKEKQVNVGALLELDNLEQYNMYCIKNCYETLTQKEYGLLKEVLL